MMRHRIQTVIGTAIGLFLVGGAQLALAAAVLDTQISPSSQMLPNRLTRNGTASVCATAKTFPGSTAVGGPYAYQSLGVVKSNVDGCVNFVIGISGSGCPAATGIFLSGYDGVFNPADLSIGYLGDSGSSATTTTAATMGLTLGAGKSIGLMVNAAEAVTGPCAVTVSSSDDVTSRTFTVFVGQLSANMPTVTPRLFRDGTASACGAAKTFPGTSGAGAYPYLSFVGVSPVATCAQATISVAGAGCAGGGTPEQVLLSAYDPFSAANIASGYLGDSGSSALTGAPQSMDIDVGANEPITLIANQTDTTAIGNCTVAVAAFDLLNDRIFADGVE